MHPATGVGACGNGQGAEAQTGTLGLSGTGDGETMLLV